MLEATKIRRHRNVAIIVVFLAVVARLFLRHPISMDDAMNTMLGRFPYALRLPISWLLLFSVIANWLYSEKQWFVSRCGAILQRIRLPRALTPSAEMAAIARRLSPPIRRFVESRVVFLTLTALTLFICRWQTLTGFEYNVDESQSTTAARMLLVDSHFWISVDVGTHGPLVSLWQLLLPVFGLAIDYAGSRLLAIAMMFWCLVAIYVVARRVAPDHLARLTLLPGIYFVASLINTDFLAYNGEYPVMFMVAISVACTAMALFPVVRDDVAGADPPVRYPFRFRLWLVFASGVALGGVSWAKQQGIPIVAAIVIVNFMLCFLAKDDDTADTGGFRRRFGPSAVRFGLFLAGLIVPTLLILSWTASNHALLQMYRSYFEWNVVYAARNRGEGIVYVVLRMQTFVERCLEEASPFATFLALIPGFPLCALLLIGIWRRRILPGTSAILATAFVSFVTWVCVVLPGNPATHYMTLMFPAFIAMNGLAWAVAMRGAGDARGRSADNIAGPLLRAVIGVIFVVQMILLPFIEWMGNAFINDPKINFAVAIKQSPLDGDDAELVPRIKLAAHPGERMAIWGWRSKLCILTNTLSGTRSSVSFRETLYDLPMQRYFFDLYLADMDKYKPVVFVDVLYRKDLLYTTYNWMTLRMPDLPRRTLQELRHDHYPELAERLRTQYTLLYTSQKGMQIFVRNDRYPEAAAKLAQMPKFSDTP